MAFQYFLRRSCCAVSTAIEDGAAEVPEVESGPADGVPIGCEPRVAAVPGVVGRGADAVGFGETPRLPLVEAEGEGGDVCWHAAKHNANKGQSAWRSDKGETKAHVLFGEHDCCVHFLLGIFCH